MENQIIQDLLLAKIFITYCESIIDYPSKNNKKNYNINGRFDVFFRSIHNSFFSQSLLIIANLLNKNDIRVVSLWNYKDFSNKKQKELSRIEEMFNKDKLKKLRDQIFAHQDINNKNNKFPYDFRQGFVDKNYIESLKKIIEGIIKEFCSYTNVKSSSFNSSEDYKEMQEILTLANPELTNDKIY